MKNKLIIFEGIDGTGKSTTVKLLRDELSKRGINVVCFEEIESKSEGFNILKAFVKKETPIESSLFYYIASSIYKSKIINELLKTKWVICDRYVYSTIAYHLSKGVDPKTIPDIKTLPITSPDFFFLLKTDEDTRINRLNKRTNTTSEDLLPKTPGSFYDLMEKSFESYKPIVIDNTKLNPKKSIEQILKIISV